MYQSLRTGEATLHIIKISQDAKPDHSPNEILLSSTSSYISHFPNLISEGQVQHLAIKKLSSQMKLIKVRRRRLHELDSLLHDWLEVQKLVFQSIPQLTYVKGWCWLWPRICVPRADYYQLSICCLEQLWYELGCQYIGRSCQQVTNVQYSLVLLHYQINTILLV